MFLSAEDMHARYFEMKCHNTFNLLSLGETRKGRNEERKGRQGGWEEGEGN